MRKITIAIRVSQRRTLEIVFAIIVALLLILLAKFAFGQHSISEKDASRIAGSYTNSKKNHALVVGVINGNDTQYFTYGESDKGTGSKPSAQSIFEVGTVSCVFTTSLLSLFEEQGKVNLTDPIQNYFPQAVHIPVYQKIICHPSPEPIHYPTILNCYPDPMYHPKQIVLCDLSTHTSGLPELPTNLHENKKDAYTHYSLDDMYHFLNNFNPNFQTGLHYDFSPFGVAMLANGFTWKFNTDFESLLKTNLLSPLQLSNTFITGSEEQRMQQVPGHDKKGKKIDDIKYGVLGAALSIHTNAEDLARFVSANINCSDSVLRMALRNAQQPKVAILNNKKLHDTYGSMGWMISPLKENSQSKIVWQSSTLNGYACYVGFVVETKTGVVVLSNSVQPVDDIGKKILLLMNEETKGAENTPTH